MKRLWALLVWILATLLLLVACAPPAEAQVSFFGWRFEEMQPDIPNGGRANTITVHPANDDVMLVTTESGGLFRTTDRGATWTHVDGLPAYLTNAVAYVPDDPDVVILTTLEDFRTANGGGIWRSVDGGLHWMHVTPGPPQPPGVPDRLSAYEISIAPDTGKIHVGHNWGLSISSDQGLTWTHVDPFGSGDRRVFSVLAQPGGRIIAAGPAGVRRSPDGGATWLAATTGPGEIWDLHALGGSPFDPRTAYAVNGNTQLFFTMDAGDTWTRIPAAPGGGGGCGGITFVKAIGHTFGFPPFPPQNALRLWFGNRCGLSTLDATPVGFTPHFTYGGSWTNRAIDHSDTRDLAFTNAKEPLLLGTDGGLHHTADGGMHWTFTGGGRDGFNALQITEVKGQWINNIGRYDLYFGTQDNNLYASSDNGATWINPWCCEGFFIERTPRVDQAVDSKITFRACGGCDHFLADPLFTNVTLWPDPPAPGGTPKIVNRSFYVQGIEADGIFQKGMAQTPNLGMSWSQYAEIPEDRRDLSKLAIPGTFQPVLYQSIRTGWDAAGNFEVNTLARVVKRLLASGANVFYPAHNNFGGLGIKPTMWAWYQVFGVDSGNSTHVIAPDVVNQRMMETWDGGENWTEIPGLTSMVTSGGAFLFRRGIFPFASAVSFSPNDPNMVAVGTLNNGVFVSGDRGATWTKVPDSEGATDLTSIEWKTGNEAVISSYGRGLWRLTWGLVRPFPDVDSFCDDRCTIDPFPPFEDPPSFDEALLVFAGRIQGARFADGALRELFVSPGSSVVFFTDAGKVAEVTITESMKEVGWGDLEPPQPRDGQQLVGLGLSGWKPAAAMHTEGDLALYEPTKEEREQVDIPMSEESPTKGRPYIELSNTVSAGDALEIRARDFPANTDVEIVVDDRVMEKTRVPGDGVLVTSLPAPPEHGLHVLTIRDAQTRTILDGANFLVQHEDEF